MPRKGKGGAGAGGGKYGDKRWLFMRALMKRQCRLERQHWTAQTASSFSKAATYMSLLPLTPKITSVTQAKKIPQVGAICAKTLKEADTGTGILDRPPAPSMFCSSGPAILVALFDAEQAVLDGDETAGFLKTGDAGQPVALVRRRELIRRAQPICEERFKQMAKDEVDTGKRTSCMAWNRHRHLIAMGYIRERKLKKESVYQLLDVGRTGRGLEFVGADQLRRRLRGKPETPVAAGLGNNHLYTNDIGEPGVVLLVDTREGGGDRHANLHNLCQALAKKVTYRTEGLACADYMWVFRDRIGGKEICLPTLVERKRADDFAASMADNRLERQKKKMLRARKYFGCTNLLFLIEGEAKAFVLPTCCDRRCVGKHGHPSEDEVNLAIEALDREPHFAVLRSDGFAGTADLLVQTTREYERLWNHNPGGFETTGHELKTFQAAVSSETKCKAALAARSKSGEQAAAPHHHAPAASQHPPPPAKSPPLRQPIRAVQRPKPCASSSGGSAAGAHHRTHVSRGPAFPAPPPRRDGAPFRGGVLPASPALPPVLALHDAVRLSPPRDVDNDAIISLLSDDDDSQGDAGCDPRSRGKAPAISTAPPWAPSVSPFASMGLSRLERPGSASSSGAAATKPAAPEAACDTFSFEAMGLSKLVRPTKKRRVD